MPFNRTIMSNHRELHGGIPMFGTVRLFLFIISILAILFIPGSLSAAPEGAPTGEPGSAASPPATP